jgi:endonuclease G
MATRDIEGLKHYLSLITRKRGGVEGQIEALTSNPESVVARTPSGSMESAVAEPPAIELAVQGLKDLALDKLPSEPALAGLEAIINEDLRPAVDVVDGRFSMVHPLWKHLSDDATIRKRIESIVPSIGRIELPGQRRLPYGGTGFVVGDGLIMTNRHVAELFAKGLGDQRVNFIDGSKAAIDFLREQGRPTMTPLAVRKIVMIHPYWDMAILAVDGLPASRKPLRLSLQDARDLVGHDIFIVGYPAFDPRNPADVQNDVFEGRFGVKKLQPGELQGGMKTASFGKLVNSATHDCSTLGGNSGSAIIDLQTGEVFGLHFGGLYHQRNYSVPSFELGRDARVIDTGVTFAGSPVAGAHDWTAWWSRADAMDDPEPEDTDDGARAKTSTLPKQVRTVVAGNGSVRIEVPLHITIALGETGTITATISETAISDSIEAMREPFRDSDYSLRTGYSPDFLNAPDQESLLAPVRIPMPSAKQRSVLARGRNGESILHYENFSIAMHAKRRLALFSAANVTEEERLRKPDARKKYTRKALTGLGANDQERWFIDPRLEERFQLPDNFFTKDRQAFDKGHIVRRDDVAWGATYDNLRRANGDSFHVTNCSPQIAEFNRSNKGEANWGDLENLVLSEAANERLCVFAGPVLNDADEVFIGKGDGGITIRAKIPSRFWKVIVSRVEDGIAAFGFVLEQDLSDVQFEEFTVPPEFKPAMYPIQDIEEMSKVRFDASIRRVDQYETLRGAEIRRRAGVSRRGRKR